MPSYLLTAIDFNIKYKKGWQNRSSRKFGAGLLCLHRVTSPRFYLLMHPSSTSFNNNHQTKLLPSRPITQGLIITKFVKPRFSRILTITIHLERLNPKTLHQKRHARSLEANRWVFPFNYIFNIKNALWKIKQTTHYNFIDSVVCTDGTIDRRWPCLPEITDLVLPDTWSGQQCWAPAPGNPSRWWAGGGSNCPPTPSPRCSISWNRWSH